MIGEDAVVLFGHGAVEAAQAGFDVRHGDVEFHRRECPRERGVGVAVDQHPVRALAEQHFLDGDEHLAGLFAV